MSASLAIAPAPAGRRRFSDHLVGRVVFPLWAQREHRGYAGFRRGLERTQFWTPAQITALQQQRLGALLRYANERCPFYRDRFAAAGLRPGAWDAAAWQRLPLLTKPDIQNHGPAIAAHGFPTRRRIWNQTGGSTGSPLQFLVDTRRMATRMASTHRHNAWTGLRPGDWVAEVWGAALDAPPEGGWWNLCRNHALHRTLFFNTARIEAARWDLYLAELRRRRPRFLVAYARSAWTLARYVLDHSVTDIRFESIITSSEILTEPMRHDIERAFGGRVYNRYGCREVSVIASECGEHDGLHVNAEALLVEIVPSPEFPAPWGRVVITDLLNRSMPLIRYAIGDVARWAEGACPCGRGLPRLAEIQGRVTDFLHLPGGGSVCGVVLLTMVFADMPSVRQVQFLQRGEGEVRLRLVPGRGYGESTRQLLRQRLALYLRNAVPLAIEEVDAIASEASGKYRFVIHEPV